MLLILASTISPFLMVSSRLFLEMKSYITRMSRGFDPPELKNTSKGVRRGFKHLILLSALVRTVCFVGDVVVVSTWLKSTQKKHKVLLFFSPSSFSPNCLSVCPGDCLMSRFTWLGAGAGAGARAGVGRGFSSLLTGLLGSGAADTSGGCQPSKNSSVYVGMSSSSSGHFVLVILSKITTDYYLHTYQMANSSLIRFTKPKSSRTLFEEELRFFIQVKVSMQQCEKY